MNLVESYEKYAFRISIQNAQNLFNSIIEYDFSNYLEDIDEIKKIHRCTNNRSNYNIDAHEFRSNGSTSNRFTLYPFKPNFNFWHENLNNFIRNPIGTKSQKFRPYNFKGDSFFADVFNPSKEKYVDYNKFFQDQNMNYFLINFHSEYFHQNLSKMLNEYPDSSLQMFGKPHDFLPLMTEQNLLETLAKKADLLSCTCDYSALPRKNQIYFNDHMLSWKSGIYFYTCQKHEKHFLPLCYQHNNSNFNILNLSYPLVCDQDDSFEYLGTKTCNCGKIRPIIKYIGHHKNMIKDHENNIVIDEITNAISGRYTWLQLLLDQSHELYVFFSENSEIMKDLGSYQEIIKPKKTHLMKNKSFLIGLNKYPILWKTYNEVKINRLSLNKFMLK